MWNIGVVRSLLVLSGVLLLFSCSHLSRNNPDKKFEVSGGKLIVPVLVDGVRMRFLLDTGCGASGFIREQRAESLPLAKVPGKAARSGGWGGKKKEWTIHHFYTVAKFRIGDAEFGNIELLGRKDFWEFDVDGMLCTGLLKTKNLMIDYRSSSVSVEDGEVELAHSVPFEFRNGREILVKVTIAGSEVENFVFDTGASVVHVAQETSERLGLKAVEGEEIEIGDSKGDTEKAKYVIAPRICLGELCANELRLVSAGFHKYQTDFQRNGILGFPFLNGHKFVISFAKRVIYYE